MKKTRMRVARILSILMILSLLTGGAALAGAGPVSLYSYAETQTEGDFEYTVSGGAATLTAYNGKDAAPVIPDSIGGCSVTAIGPECFRGNVKIIQITVPEGITEIGDYAFEACSAAEELTLPSTLETIGKAAFSGDAKLASIFIPEGVRKIDDGAFLYCMGALDISGGDGLTELGQFVFAGCENAKTADISGSELEVIPDRTFCNCSELSSVVLPDSVRTVGKRAFSRCYRLEEIYFGGSVESIGDYAFEECGLLNRIEFAESSEGLSLGSNILCDSYGAGIAHFILPDNTRIKDDTFSGAGIAGMYVLGDGKLSVRGDDGEETAELVLIEGQLYGDGGSTLVRAFSEKYDSSSQKWETATETFTDGSRTRVRYTVADGVTGIGPEAFTKQKYANVVLPASIEKIDDRAFRESVIKSVSFSGSGSNRYFVEEGLLYENADAADGEGGDQDYRLVRFFPKKLEADGNTMSDTTVDIKDDESTLLDPEKQLTLLPKVSDIAPYAFYGSEIWLVIPDDTHLSGFGDLSFANSGINDPRDGDDISFGGRIEISGEVLGRLVISDTAFQDAWIYFVDFNDDEEDYPVDPDDPDVPADPDDEGGPDIGMRRNDYPEDIEFNDRFSRFDENGEMDPYDDDDEYEIKDPVVTYKSLSGDLSLYSEEKYKNYKVIPRTGFKEWCDEYLEHNKDEIEFSQELMPYTMLYKGETHYRSMVCVLNHDQYKTNYSIMNVGDDFAPMYLMMDHGLEAELTRGEVQEDVVLYSGITDEKMAEIAGLSDKSVMPTVEQLVNAIGGEFTDVAFMSTTTDPEVAASFSSHSGTMVVIYASKESLKKLGAVCLDSFTGWGAGEYEILLNPGAKFRVLEVGSLNVGSYKRTYIRLELGADGISRKSISKANVSGVKSSYKYSGKAVKPAPVVKLGGKTLVNGTDYRLQYSSNKNVGKAKIVITGKGEYSGKITKTFKIAPKGTSIKKLKRAKKAVSVSWKKQTSKMSKSRITGYQIQVATDPKFTKGKKTVTVKGYKKASKKISKLKGKKKYYVRIRTYKKVNGANYYSAWSKAKTVKTR